LKSETKAKKLQAKADAEGDLTDTTTTRDADVKYLADLIAMFELKAADFESCQQLRAKELEAVAKAIEITSSNDASGNEVKHLPSLVQKTALTQVRASTRGETQQLAIEYLQIQGKRLDSRVLSALAVRVSDDPFTKVKKMIKGLIARLMEKANKEAEHKVGTTLICPV